LGKSKYREAKSVKRVGAWRAMPDGYKVYWKIDRPWVCRGGSLCPFMANNPKSKGINPKINDCEYINNQKIFISKPRRG